MNEIIANLHLHTRISDGQGTYSDLVREALQSEVDVVIAADHNVRVRHLEGYYTNGKRKVLLLTGEELHRMNAPQSENHLLVYGCPQEMANSGIDLPSLVQAIHKAGGVAVMAHPFDVSAPLFEAPAIPWNAGVVEGMDGIEIWNILTSYKEYAQKRSSARQVLLDPNLALVEASQAALSFWDQRLAEGTRFFAIAGSDAHHEPLRMGMIKRTFLSYGSSFKALNTHLLLSNPLRGDFSADRDLVLSAVCEGRSFIGLDAAASTCGFRFTIQTNTHTASIGDEITLQRSGTLQVRIPQVCDGSVICNGEVIYRWKRQEAAAVTITQPGAYRVECRITRDDRSLGWIYSNPIYVKRRA